MSEPGFCQARVHSREFGWGRCYNAAKTIRYGLDVCNVHARMVDRLAAGHGDEYALGIARYEWCQPDAALPRLPRVEVQPWSAA